jgi:hypothetical protein
LNNTADEPGFQFAVANNVHESGRRGRLLLELVEIRSRAVAHDLPVDQVDDVLRDVGGVVADPLECLETLRRFM